jgi:hypothetical protein
VDAAGGVGASAVADSPGTQQPVVTNEGSPPGIDFTHAIPAVVMTGAAVWMALREWLRG